MIDDFNEAQEPKNFLLKPKCRKPRTVLTWLENEIKYGLGAMSNVHGNALRDY
jgi:hypothetical protein